MFLVLSGMTPLFWFIKFYFCILLFSSKTRLLDSSFIFIVSFRRCHGQIAGQSGMPGKNCVIKSIHGKILWWVKWVVAIEDWKYFYLLFCLGNLVKHGSRNWFYMRKVYHWKCLRHFLEDMYTKHCLRSTNKILEALKKEQDILLKCEIFMRKKFFKKNHIILCKKVFGVFLIEDECECQMTECSFF